ncbi:hypothetical protein UPYG_G00145740, partial [Umbra pygmaea]
MSEAEFPSEDAREGAVNTVQQFCKENPFDDSNSSMLNEKAMPHAFEEKACDTQFPQETSQGQRVRKLTEKGQELQEERVKKLQQRFNFSYDKWSIIAKDATLAFDACCSNELRQVLAGKIRKASMELHLIYEDMRRICTPHPDIRRRVDICDAKSKEIVETKGNNEKEDRGKPDFELLGHVAQSVKSNLSKGRRSSVSSSGHSRQSSLSLVKRQDAAAEAAANEATLEILMEQEQHFRELQRLEAEEKK